MNKLDFLNVYKRGFLFDAEVQPLEYFAGKKKLAYFSSPYSNSNMKFEEYLFFDNIKEKFFLHVCGGKGTEYYSGLGEMVIEFPTENNKEEVLRWAETRGFRRENMKPRNSLASFDFSGLEDIFKNN